MSDIVSGRRRLRGALAQASLAISVASRADIERTLEFAVKQEVLTAELAKRSVAYAAEARSLASETSELVKKKYHAGAVSEADVARTDVQRLQAEQAVNSSVQALTIAKAQLSFLLGIRGTAADTIDVADDLTRNVPQERFNRLTAEELRARAIARRPDVVAVRAQIERARTSIELARRLRIPDFSPSMQYSREGRGQSAIQPPTVTFGIGAPLPLLNRYRGEVAKAEADLTAQQVTRERLETQVAADVTAAFASFTSARERIVRMESSLLPQAQRARDLVRLQYEKGATSIFEFLDAQRTLLATQTDYMQSLSDYWTAVFQLEQASGTELL